MGDKPLHPEVRDQLDRIEQRVVALSAGPLSSLPPPDDAANESAARTPSLGSSILSGIVQRIGQSTIPSESPGGGLRRAQGSLAGVSDLPAGLNARDLVARAPGSAASTIGSTVDMHVDRGGDASTGSDDARGRRGSGFIADRASGGRPIDAAMLVSSAGPTFTRATHVGNRATDDAMPQGPGAIADHSGASGGGEIGAPSNRGGPRAARAGTSVGVYAPHGVVTIYSDQAPDVDRDDPRSDLGIPGIEY